MKAYYYDYDKETGDFYVYSRTPVSTYETLYSGIPEEDDAVKLETILNRMEEYAVRV